VAGVITPLYWFLGYGGLDGGTECLGDLVVERWNNNHATEQRERCHSF
jgi:hypothetical protein